MNTKLISRIKQLLTMAENGEIIGLAYASIGEGECPNGWEVVDGQLTEQAARGLTNAAFTVANHMVKMWFTPPEGADEAALSNMTEIVEH